jgi:AraC-like DNA-binding protein
MRGVYRYADEHGHFVFREFLVPRTLVGKAAFTAALRDLLDWAPDAILSGLMDDDLPSLRRVVGDAMPLVNVYASTPGPRLGVVTGSHSSVLAEAIRHLQQIGIREPLFLVLESGAVERRLVPVITGILPDFQAERDLLVQPLDLRVLEDPDAAVQPIPPRLQRWIDSHPRPMGVFCIGMGGGDYLVRVCRELGLRVPDDVAVVGMDDADVCLRSTPSLSSVMPVGEQVGTEAMRLLDRMLQGADAPPEPIRIAAVELAARHSSARRTLRCDIPAAIRFIDEHACRGIGIDEVLAQMPHGSRMTFYQEFQRVVDMTPGDYIRSVQIAEAKRLLANTHWDMVQIATCCGFSGGSAFARIFRTVAGLTPSQYRRRALQDPPGTPPPAP